MECNWNINNLVLMWEVGAFSTLRILPTVVRKTLDLALISPIQLSVEAR